MIIAMRTSIAGEGSTEPNLYFACGKMQTDPDSPPIKKTTLEVVFFIALAFRRRDLNDNCNADEHCRRGLDRAEPLFCLRKNANRSRLSANKKDHP